LDVYANEVFIQTLINREIVCGIASEENDDFITVEGAITVITTNMWS
jgi:fructose-1,6-bisphosphatase I